MKKICFSLLVLGMVSCSSDYVTNDFTPGTPVETESPETPVETETPETPVDPEIPSEPGEEPTPQLNCLPASLQANLIASYNFANGSILDGSGNNNNLSYTNGTVPSVSDRAGNQNCAIQFNGTNHLQLIDFSQLENQSKLSISLWFQNNEVFDGVSSSYNLPNRPRYFILGETATPYNNPNQGLRKSFFVGQFDCLRVFSSNGGSHELWESEDSFPYDLTCGGPRVDVWNHVVINFDSVNAVFEIYVNGILTSQTNPVYNQYFNELNEVFIGKGMYGTLDDIFIFNDVLSASQVTELMNLQPCCN